MGAIWPLLVITGMHRVFTPTILQTISETGMEGTVMPSEIGANLSLGGVSLAVALKTKNRELRQTALAAASSALIAGTTEPALYGVAVRLKRLCWLLLLLVSFADVWQELEGWPAFYGIAERADRCPVH